MKWGSDDLDNYLNFYSVSGDGRVSNWTLVKSALWSNDKLLINFCKNLQNIPKDTQIDKLMGKLRIILSGLSSSNAFLDSGRALAFKPDDETIYLVGTDEGLIHLCTTEYSSQYLNTYEAHNTPVYNIQWNTFLPSVFITCAAEWGIKIWDKDYRFVPIVILCIDNALC